MLKQFLNLKLSQKLSPQQIQLMKLIQLPTQAFEQRLIEEMNENRFFKHIKSFSYFKQPNYSELLSFLSSGKFQVCIYGHSCGLSDRVMLNEIFEHDNCHSIRVFYYNKDEYITKTMDISRHFDSNKLMRQRIINFDESDRIPQYTDD